MSAFRLALRRLRHAPGFSAAAVLTLGLGIAAATALFAVVDAVLLSPLPFREPDRLVWIWATHTDRDRAFFSIPDFRDVRARNHTLEDIAPIATWAVNLVDTAREEGAGAERLSGARIAPSGFALLGARALHGRTLQAGDDAPDRRHVVVLGNALWHRRFHADPTVVGRPVSLDGERYTVVGVLAADFALPNVDGDVYAPLTFDNDPRAEQRGSNFLRAFGRLPPGTSAHRAADDLAAIARRLAAEYPATDAKMTAPRLIPLDEEIAGPYRRGLLLLLGAVAAVLAIACANFAGLSLARLQVRRGELALRAALGATRRRLAGMVFAESALLAAASGAVGALLAPWGIELIRAAAPADLPRAAGIGVDARVAAFAAAAALVCALLTGIAPALGAARATAGAVHGGGMGGVVGAASPRRRRGARDGLIVAQLALSLVLMVSAGLLARSFARVAGVDPGFDPRGLIAVKLSLPRAGYASPDAVSGFHRALAARAAEIPAVESVATASYLPLAGANARTDFAVVGRPAATTAEAPGAQRRFVGPGYFHTLRIPLRAGREFVAADDARGRPVAVVDRALARRFLDGIDPVGAHLVIDDGVKPVDVEIVGVVGDVPHFSLAEPPMPTLYFPVEQLAPAAAGQVAAASTLVVRARAVIPPEALRTTVASLDDTVAVSVPASLERVISDSLAPRRLALALVALFAGAALLLAAAGLATSVAAAVSARTREIGVRLALGGTASAVVRGVVAEAARPIVAGVVVGALASTVLARAIAALAAASLDPGDPVPFVAAAALLAAVGLVAAWIPARRAARIDPMVALRAQ